MAEETPAKTVEAIRKGCEPARGHMVSILADDILEALDYLEGKLTDNDPPKRPDIKS